MSDFKAKSHSPRRHRLYHSNQSSARRKEDSSSKKDPTAFLTAKLGEAIKEKISRHLQENRSNNFTPDHAFEDHPSDTSSIRAFKKRKRKEARRIAREAKDRLKTEDPFSYYIKGNDGQRNDSGAATSHEVSKRFNKSLDSSRRRARFPATGIHTRRSGSEESSEYVSSEEDDKTNPAFWRRDNQYMSLPENVRNAIEVGKLKAKHSDFYYKLKGLNEKISTYKEIFYDKIPKFQMAYMQKQVERKQDKQKKEREVFEKEIQAMSLPKKRLNRYMSLANVFEGAGAGAISRLVEKHGGNPYYPSQPQVLHSKTNGPVPKSPPGEGKGDLEVAKFNSSDFRKMVGLSPTGRSSRQNFKPQPRFRSQGNMDFRSLASLQQSANLSPPPKQVEQPKAEIDLLDTLQPKKKMRQSVMIKGRDSSDPGSRRRSTLRGGIGLVANLGQRKDFKNKIFRELNLRKESSMHQSPIGITPLKQIQEEHGAVYEEEKSSTDSVSSPHKTGSTHFRRSLHAPVPKSALGGKRGSIQNQRLSTGGDHRPSTKQSITRQSDANPPKFVRPTIETKTAIMMSKSVLSPTILSRQESQASPKNLQYKTEITEPKHQLSRGNSQSGTRPHGRIALLENDYNPIQEEGKKKTGRAGQATTKALKPASIKSRVLSSSNYGGRGRSEYGKESKPKSTAPYRPLGEKAGKNLLSRDTLSNSVMSGGTRGAYVPKPDPKPKGKHKKMVTTTASRIKSYDNKEALQALQSEKREIEAKMKKLKQNKAMASSLSRSVYMAPDMSRQKGFRIKKNKTRQLKEPAGASKCKSSLSSKERGLSEGEVRQTESANFVIENPSKSMMKQIKERIGLRSRAASKEKKKAPLETMQLIMQNKKRLRNLDKLKDSKVKELLEIASNYNNEIKVRGQKARRLRKVANETVVVRDNTESEERNTNISINNQAAIALAEQQRRASQTVDIVVSQQSLGASIDGKTDEESKQLMINSSIENIFDSNLNVTQDTSLKQINQSLNFHNTEQSSMSLVNSPQHRLRVQEQLERIRRSTENGIPAQSKFARPERPLAMPKFLQREESEAIRRMKSIDKKLSMIKSGLTESAQSVHAPGRGGKRKLQQTTDNAQRLKQQQSQHDQIVQNLTPMGRNSEQFKGFKSQAQGKGQGPSEQILLPSIQKSRLSKDNQNVFSPRNERYLTQRELGSSVGTSEAGTHSAVAPEHILVSNQQLKPHISQFEFQRTSLEEQEALAHPQSLANLKTAVRRKKPRKAPHGSQNSSSKNFNQSLSMPKTGEIYGLTQDLKQELSKKSNKQYYINISIFQQLPQTQNERAKGRKVLKGFINKQMD